MDKKAIIDLIQDQVKQMRLNNFSAIGLCEERMWQRPMIGFASGGDPMFEFLKKDIGDFYMTPQEVFRTKYNDASIGSGDLTVISLAFAQTAVTKEEQAQQKEEPGIRWMLTRNTWKIITDELYAGICGALDAHGVRFVVPDLMPEMEIKNSEKYGKAAVWSQRHTAMVAGLGTFGLSEGLITRQGIAMRLASIVIDKKIEPDKREYEHYQQWCAFYRDGSCGACIKRCPVGAITKAGHDKKLCSEYVDKMGEKHGKNPLIDPKVEVGCGLCQSAVPCGDGVSAF